MSWERIETKDREDFRDLQGELLGILDKEEAKLETEVADLMDLYEGAGELSEAERAVYRRTYGSIKQSAVELASEFRELRREIQKDPKDREDLVLRFNYSGIRVGPAVRRSVYLRTVLTRHTPTLRGRPVSPHPQQMYPVNSRSGSITVDYLRASCLFDVETLSEGIVRKRHPILDGYADEVADILFEAKPDVSLSFNGAMGGIKTAREIMEANCSSSSRTILLHQKSWMEITSDVEWAGTGLYEFIEETNGTELLELLQRDEVGGLIVEPILNHEKMSRMAVEELLNELKTVDRFDQPTYLLVDSVHVPEFDPFSSVGDELPENLCLINVVSTVKYLQAGWDLTKGGVLSVGVNTETFDGTPLKRLLQSRENNGTGISYEEAALMAIETPDSFHSRMSRYDRNVELMWKDLSPVFQNGDLDLGFVEGSRLIYIDSDGTETERLGELHDSFIERAKSEKIPLKDASSYGMNSPHIHLGVHSAEGPVIRMSPGSTNYSTVRELSNIIGEELERAGCN